MVLQVDLYTGALFIQQSLGWDLYLSIFVLIAIVGLICFAVFWLREDKWSNFA